VFLTGGAAATVVVAALTWVGAQAWQAKDELIALLPLADEFSTAVSARDAGTAEDIAVRFRAHADRARDLTGSPLWSLAELTPGIGPNLAALRTTSAQLSVVGESVLEPVLEVAGSLTGTLDAGRIAGARVPLARAAAALTSARDALDEVDADGLLPPLAEGVAHVQSAFEAGAPVLDGLAQAGAVLPGLLGADGPREILVMVQNNAELRTGGGITGSFVQLHVEGGSISLARQADSSVFAGRAEAIAPVPDSSVALYGDRVGRFVQNATMTPDFAVSAQLASAWWQSAFGVAPDAVVAIDPLVLRALLAVHGPVTLPDGSALAAEDIVQRVLVDPYLHLDPQRQTAYQQEVAATVLSALTAEIEPVRWAEALTPVIGEGRVSVWSAVPAEQEVLAASVVGGPRARHEAAGEAAYAVYLNDATGGKMDSYLDVSIAADVDTCTDGAPATVVRVTLSNTARAEGIPELPASMTGGGLFGTAVGDIGTSVTVVAPADAAFGGVTGAEGPVPSADVLDDGRPSTAVRVNVSPGQTETVEFRFLLPPGRQAQPVIVHTPLLREAAVSTSAEACVAR
jgi:hypothetical protein